MQVELKRHKAIHVPPDSKADPDTKAFSRKHGLQEGVARRILSISKNGDQARSIAELMK